jgi:CheY-like chemotaxis protein
MSRPDGPVLIVDDDDDSRIMLATLLTVDGYRVITASNGAQALDQARLHHPCLILLDLTMPVMDGRTFRERQLADRAIRDIPVALVTAVHDIDQQAKSLRAAACISKPFDFDTLRARVAAACGGAA